MPHLLLGFFLLFHLGSRFTGPHYHSVFVEADGKGMERLAQLVNVGHLKQKIFAQLPLEQIADAHEMVESGHSKGKVVVVVSEVSDIHPIPAE